MKCAVFKCASSNAQLTGVRLLRNSFEASFATAGGKSTWIAQLDKVFSAAV